MSFADEEQDAREKIARAERAKAILDSAMFRGAVQAVRDRIFKEFCHLDPSRTDLMQLNRLTIGNLEALIAELRRHMNDAAAGQKELEVIERRKRLRRV